MLRSDRKYEAQLENTRMTNASEKKLWLDEANRLGASAVCLEIYWELWATGGHEVLTT